MYGEVFFRNLIELFRRTMKKIKYQARYEIFRQKSSTLNALRGGLSKKSAFLKN